MEHVKSGFFDQHAFVWMIHGFPCCGQGGTSVIDFLLSIHLDARPNGEGKDLFSVPLVQDDPEAVPKVVVPPFVEGDVAEIDFGFEGVFHYHFTPALKEW